MKKIVVLSLLLLMAGVLSGCIKIVGITTTRTLTVLVVDAENGRLISDPMTVRVSNRIALTEGGKVLFTDLSKGTFTVSVSGPGFLESKKEVTISKGDQEIEIRLFQEEQVLEAFVFNLRQTNLSLKELWDPHTRELKQHLETKVIPFGEELSDLVMRILEPLNDPNPNFQFERTDTHLYFSLENYYQGYTVLYRMNIVHSLQVMAQSMEPLLDIEFELKKGSRTLAKGMTVAEAKITRPDLYTLWMNWLTGGNLEQPSELFFSASKMSGEAWFETASQGRITTETKMEFNKNECKMEGNFKSPVLEHSGLLEMNFQKGAFLPEELTITGNLTLPEIAKIEGSLVISYDFYDYETSIPRNVTLDGSYATTDKTMAEGTFYIKWLDANTLGGFQGFIHTADGIPVELTLDADFSGASGTIEMEFNYGGHFLKGIGYVTSFSNFQATLVNEHNLIINLNIVDYPHTTELGTISDARYNLLAKLELQDEEIYIHHIADNLKGPLFN